jgi:hypothetical protein
MWQQLNGERAKCPSALARDDQPTNPPRWAVGTLEEATQMIGEAMALYLESRREHRWPLPRAEHRKVALSASMTSASERPCSKIPRTA